MTPRQAIMTAITHTLREVKNAHTRDLRFEAMDKLDLLREILVDVTNFEKKLLTDLDVD